MESGNRTNGITLLPCPFCGSHQVDLQGDDELGWLVACAHCHATACDCAIKADAVEAWNTRAERTCHVESMHGYTDPFASTRYSVGLSCHTLEDWPDREPPEFCPWCGAKVVEE